MVLEVGRVSGGVGAPGPGAGERPLPGVTPVVDLKGGVPRSSVVAELVDTDKRLFTGMYAYMCLEVALVLGGVCASVEGAEMGGGSLLLPSLLLHRPRRDLRLRALLLPLALDGLDRRKSR